MICVTGGSGFFGNALVKKLISLGEHIRVLDREPMDESLMRSVDFKQVDIRNRAEVIRALGGCELIYHNAAVVPISRSGKDFWSINKDGTANVLEGAWRAGARRFIHYSTSSSFYGIPKSLPVTESTPPSPLGDYGHSKYAAEETCRQYRAKGLNISIIRPRTIVGAGRLGIFQILFEWIRKGSPVYLIGKGDNKLQLIGLPDLIEVSLLLQNHGDFEDFNIGAEKFGSLKEDLGALIRYAHSGSRLKSVPYWLARPALKILDALRLSPLVDLHYKTIDKDFYFDISKAKKILGWRPQQSNQDCLKEAYDWYAANFQVLDQSYGTTHRKAVKKKLLSLLNLR